MVRGAVGGWLSLLRQGLELDIDFGTHSIEAMAGIAEVVAASVYRRGTLGRTEDGIRFVLQNPPLRLGAFGTATLVVNGSTVPGDRWTVAPADGARVAGSDITAATPLELRPGVPVEIRAAVGPVGDTVRVRLELTSVAIPPRVWIEFDDAPSDGSP